MLTTSYSALLQSITDGLIPLGFTEDGEWAVSGIRSSFLTSDEMDLWQRSRDVARIRNPYRLQAVPFAYTESGSIQTSVKQSSSVKGNLTRGQQIEQLEKSLLASASQGPHFPRTVIRLLEDAQSLRSMATKLDEEDQNFGARLSFLAEDVSNFGACQTDRISDPT
ncbi:MAG: hypothetical protein ACREQ5_04525 [Candidatus Dormibacteria bacterium]